jgi:hypothetical protein
MHLPYFKITLRVPAIAALLLLSAPGAQPAPAAVSSIISNVKTSSIEARGFNGNGLATLFLAVKNYLEDHNAFLSLLIP